MLDWLLGVNVNRSLARTIYATTPHRPAHPAPTSACPEPVSRH
ncbi:MAG: hypothetical protein VB135_05225 [Burkholderia sp.]